MVRKNWRDRLAATDSDGDCTLFVRVFALRLIVVLIDGDRVDDGSSVVCISSSDLTSFWLVWVGSEGAR